MNKHKSNFSDRIKLSAQKMLEKEISQFQSWDNEYKLSNSPIKRTFLSISKLNSLYKGQISIQEISNDVNLSFQDIKFIIQEFIEQRLIDGYIKDDLLILKQDYYYCQIDQTQHNVFELRLQCVQCLRFICSSCYRKGYGSECPFCKGSLRPVPRIFKEEDVKLASYDPKTIRQSINDFYKTQKSIMSEKGLKEGSTKIIDDMKHFRDEKNLSFSNLKERIKNYWDYRKQEDIISKNEKIVVDTISALYEIEENPEIPLIRISKLTNLDVAIVHKIVSRLIALQTINGFIETGGTYEDIKDDLLILESNVFRCEIHSEELPINKKHYQCSFCFRTICEKCHEEIKNQGISGCLFCGEKMIYFPESKR